MLNTLGSRPGRRRAPAQKTGVVYLADLGIKGFPIDGNASSAPDETLKIQRALNRYDIIRGDPNRRYKIRKGLVRTRGNFSFEDVWLYGTAAGFNNTAPGSPFVTNGIFLYVHGALSGGFAPIVNPQIRRCTFESEVSDGRQLSVLVVRNAEDAIIEENEFFNFPSAWAIRLDSVVGGNISRNHVHDFLYDVDTLSASGLHSLGIGIDSDRLNSISSADLLVDDNHIHDIVFGATAVAEYGDQTDGISSGPSVNITIRGNRIDNVGEAIDSYSIGALISDNHITRARVAGIKLPHSANRILCTNNRINQFGLAGVWLITQQGTIEDMEDMQILGNNITDGDYLGTWSSNDTAGIFVDGQGGGSFKLDGALIAHNIIRPGAADYAIRHQDAGAINVHYDGNLTVAGAVGKTFFNTNTTDSVYHNGLSAVLRKQVTLNDDSATSFPVPAGIGGFGVVVGHSNGAVGSRPYAFFWWDTAGTYQVELIAKDTNVNFTTGALAGTTGTDAKVTISIGTSPDAKIYLENRGGAEIIFEVFLSPNML